MSYTKQTWANGDTITAAKLNHMEDGIEGAGGGDSGLFIVRFNVTMNGGTPVFSCDKTYAQISAEYQENGVQNMVGLYNGCASNGIWFSEDQFYNFAFWVCTDANDTFNRFLFGVKSNEIVGSYDEYTLTAN